MRQYAPKTVGKWVGRFCAEGVDTSQPEIGISKASVSRILKRRGLSRLSSLELQEPHPRYEREKPGEIIHAVSAAWATASPDAAQAIAAVKVLAGNSSTSLSTTILG
jgi:hypothetical protein